jgi:hypothetical protein
VSEAIPIINSLTGEQTGTISVSEDGVAVITGTIQAPWGNIEQPIVVMSPELPPYVLVQEAVPLDIEPPDPQLTETLAEVFPSTYERLLAEPRWAKAAEKGLAIHFRALTLSEEEGVPYAEAIKRAAEE